ncbi:MAG: hypothetical protein ACK5ER_04880, partial [Aphanizomenon sp.]
MQTQELNGIEADLEELLTNNHLEPSKLSTFQRIILTTDGTLTEILESYLMEKIQIIKLSEKPLSIT